MTKYSRITGKVFGASADPVGTDPNIGPEIGQFGSALAGTYNGTSDVATIQNLPAWQKGFISAVTPSTQFPPLPEMTGLCKVLSQQICYLLQQGVAEYDSGTTYYKGNWVSYNNELYFSIADGHTGVVPTDISKWTKFTGSASRNLGEIVTSSLPLNDNTLHLADGALLSQTNYPEFLGLIDTLYNFACIEKYPKDYIQLHGSVTLTNGILSNFSASNYGYITNVRDLFNDTQECKIKFTTGNSLTWGGICKGYPFSDVGIFQTNNIYYLRFANLYYNDYIDVNVSTNTTYYVKVVLNGNQRTFSYSTDDVTYTTAGTITENNTTNTELRFGEASGAYFANGTIDLNETKIKCKNSSFFVSEADWQAEYNTYGECGKYVYNSSANTVRIPLYNSYFTNTSNADELGNLTPASIPNLKGVLPASENVYKSGTPQPDYGVFRLNTYNVVSGQSDNTHFDNDLWNFDASRSSSVYKDSATTVNTQSIKQLVYIVVAK